MNRFLLKCFSENRKPVPSTYSGQALSHAEGFKNAKWLALSVIAFVLVMTGAVAHAQQPKKLFRIGYISGSDAATDAARSEPFRQAVFAALSKELPDGLFVGGGALMTTHRKRIAGYALTKRLPSVFTDREALRHR